MLAQGNALGLGDTNKSMSPNGAARSLVPHIAFIDFDSVFFA